MADRGGSPAGFNGSPAGFNGPPAGFNGPPAGFNGLMAVHAHPDDEVITTGGVLARAVQQGRRATVVTCTGGEVGEIVGEGMEPDKIRPRLAQVRLAELERALEILGADGPRMLGYRDSGMMATDDNSHVDAFWQANIHDAVGRLVGHLRDVRPAVVVTYDAFGNYGHPDHIQAHRVCVLAVEAASTALYPELGSPWTVSKLYLSTIPRSAIVRINGEMAARNLPSPFGTETNIEALEALAVGTPDDRIGAEIDVHAWLDQKWSALRAHRSQVSEDSFFLNTPADLREQMFGKEYFIRARSLVQGEGVETDLFDGLN